MVVSQTRDLFDHLWLPSRHRGSRDGGEVAHLKMEMQNQDLNHKPVSKLNASEIQKSGDQPLWSKSLIHWVK
jgi:hypothetical protein